ncbi:MotA/TolQ/ExbB proton channel family protein [Mesobaculum littorinae]|uniref:MotA/TolQ/ExbB proton channel family protein n=1 Tax=Mesobaculum littorinae TaxID=2486419 RepID=A0A438AIR8_9RHOB|nr:MotA/TolQ/ExbB proton channel family protein [Mesobaculum littorinae]RVV98558.1 MotA/TolQ/ExbB proton channel family protein [Mesobaculum littorinae]
MIDLTSGLDRLRGLVELGGPVVAILILLSVIAGAVLIYKLVQFRRLGVGRHRAIRRGLDHWDGGAEARAISDFRESRNHLAPVLAQAAAARAGTAPAAAADMGPGTAPDLLKSRIEALAAVRLARLERGFRMLDSIAQIAPLLGLFGTVLGMIDAFRALQDAGSSVDPSILAGGIWVALMTTAVGLAVAMPSSLVLTWFETRVERERGLIEAAIETVFCPMGARVDSPAAQGAAPAPRTAGLHAH